MSDPVQVDGRDRVATIDLSVYGMDAVLKAAYRFSGRCFLHLQTSEPNHILVRMRPKNNESDPDTVIREFFNEMLDQRLRSIISTETACERDLIMAHALSRTNFIQSDLETAEPAEDPRQIATPDKRHAPVA